MFNCPDLRVAHVRALLRFAVPAVLLLMLRASWAQSAQLNPALPLVQVDNPPNSQAAQQQHYVVLVSLDGFRWDYVKQDHAANLDALAREGASAPDGMLPSFPSSTYPNHFSMATGLYPEHHGIVANHFFDPTRQKIFSAFDPASVEDGSWVTGMPLWSLAEAQGMRAACILWPGCEAEIAGHRPTWYGEYKPKQQGSSGLQQARIDDTVALLRLPAEQRPHLILIHFPAVDDAGHEFGPDAPETKAAVLKVDSAVGKLKNALDGTGLAVDLVVVSDHGMARVPDQWITLDQLADLNGFETVDSLLYAKNEQDRVRVYDQLKKASSQFMVFRRWNVPPELNDNQNEREGDPVVVATGAYAIRARGPKQRAADAPPEKGMHGYDPRRVPEMKAIFIAAGPDIVKGKTVAPFENVNLYPWLAHLLGLTPAKNDGSLNILSGTLRDGGNERDDNSAQ